MSRLPTTPAVRDKPYLGKLANLDHGKVTRTLPSLLLGVLTDDALIAIRLLRLLEGHSVHVRDN